MKNIKDTIILKKITNLIKSIRTTWVDVLDICQTRRPFLELWCNGRPSVTKGSIHAIISSFVVLIEVLFDLHQIGTHRLLHVTAHQWDYYSCCNFDLSNGYETCSNARYCNIMWWSWMPSMFQIIWIWIQMNLGAKERCWVNSSICMPTP